MAKEKHDNKETKREREAKDEREAKHGEHEAKAAPEAKHHKAAAPPQAGPKKPVRVEKENFRGIVRIAGKDVKGEVPLNRALIRVRGISHTLAVSAGAVLHNELAIDPKTRVGELSEDQIDKIDKILQNLHEYKIPAYLFNRRSDYLAGTNRHVIMNDLIFENTQDLEREKKLYTWKGYRHSYGQKVRGQRTRNTGRTGMAVGVLRKAIIAAQQAAKPGAAGAPAAGAAAAAPAAGAAKPAEKKAAPAEKK
ncbi:MAG: 30S ribosomal protein S13 [Candidatus ainarchaeum sp.]|nr:30S ribosomal protein S13 [Candidatus ainarchaeum sp.]